MVWKSLQYTALSMLYMSFVACDTFGKFEVPTYTGPDRNFSSSFESESDFSGFYIVPQGEYDSNHLLTSERANDGALSHKAWIVQARDVDNESTPSYLPHRAYPTIQFQKTTEGVYRTPCLVSIYVYLDMSLSVRTGIDDWFSFITLTPDSSDNWVRTVLVNIGPDGYLRLVHVPDQGEQTYIFQEESDAALKFPYREWVRLDMFIDFSENGGYAKVWQNQQLISYANVNGGVGGLAQAHFGLYASAAVASGVVFNDKLRIQEVTNEAEALTLVNSAY